MKKFSVSNPILTHNLSKTERDQLTDQLYAVHSQIFEGVDKESFRRYVIEPDTVMTKLFLFRNAADEIVGYLTFQVFQTEIMRDGKERNTFVYRTETGILKEYRGGAPIARILFWECFKFGISRGLPESYFLATPIGPMAYAIAHRSVGELYPRPGQDTPAHIEALKDNLSRALGLKEAGEANRFVKKVGWIVRQNEAAKQRMQRNSDEGLQYYLRENPGYEIGNGMMMLAPGTLKNALQTGLRMLGNELAFRKKRNLNKVKGIPALPEFLRPVIAMVL